MPLPLPPQDDFRIFVGDLGNETNDDVLAHAFSKYPSFQKARVVRNKQTQKTMGFGFVSFRDPWDMTKVCSIAYSKTHTHTHQFNQPSTPAIRTLASASSPSVTRT